MDQWQRNGLCGRREVFMGVSPLGLHWNLLQRSECKQMTAATSISAPLNVYELQ